jgi:hypothetical protein
MDSKSFTFLGAIMIFLIIGKYVERTEYFRGGRGRRRGRGGRGRGSILNPSMYLHNFRRRNRRPWLSYFSQPWVSPWSTWGYPWGGWGGGIPCNCKSGCTPEGCAFPGNGIDECVWASDCNCCGF